MLVTFMPGDTWAQETTAATGTLVVVPYSLHVGQTTLAVGFHVDPADLEVKIEYSGHFTPEGEPCPTAAAGATQSSVAPTWISLTACSAGAATVRLVAQETGAVIEEASVTITEPPAVIGQGTGASPTVSLSGVISSLNVGQSDSFTVSASGLDSAASYELHTVPLNNSLAFNSGCSDRRKTADLDGVTSYSTSYRAYACRSSGSVLWSYLDDQDGNSVASSGINSNRITVRPTVSLGSSSYTLNEGGSTSVTVSLNGSNGENPSVPVSFTRVTAESGDYSVSGLSGNKLVFSRGDTSKSFTITANEDSDCNNETLTVSISPPSGVGSGSPTSASVTITDDDDPSQPPCSSPPETICERYDTNNDGEIGRSELTTAIQDYFTNIITRAELQEAIDCYCEDNPPSQVQSLNANPTPGQIEATWSAPSTCSPTVYRAQHRQSGGSWPPETDADKVTGLAKTFSGLSPGTYEVRAKACNDDDRCSGWSTATGIVVPATPTVLTLPSVQTLSGRVGQSFSKMLPAASGGTLPYSYKVSGLPGGLSFNSTTRLISGTPTTARTYTVTYEVTDAVPKTVSTSFDITVSPRTVNPPPRPPNTPPSFGSTTIDDPPPYDTATVVSLPLPSASGGDGTLRYSVSGLPPGLKFASNTRTISGTPTTVGTYTVTYTVEDDDSDTAELTFEITVTLGKVTVLSAMPGSAHGEIALDWDPVDEADGYQVGRWIEQPGDLGVGVRFDWVVLQGSEVTIDQSNTSADVHGLTTGESYEHGVRAFQVVGSKTFEGPWSDRKMATPHDESPATPTGLKAEDMIGGRGISLSWAAATGATDYNVEITYPDGSKKTPTVRGVGHDVPKLVPGANYSFRVRSGKRHVSGRLVSEWSAAVTHDAPTPTTSSQGHQADHVAKYKLGAVQNSIVRNAIAPAVKLWNEEIATLGKDLEICAGNGCSNPDGYIVTIKTVAPPVSGDPNHACNTARACVIAYERDHMEHADMIFEDPPWNTGVEVDMHGIPTGNIVDVENEWTAVKLLNGRAVPCNDLPAVCAARPTRKFVYINRIMRHEFGHILGLPDFYNHSDLNGLDAVMDDGFEITDEDKAQLRAIYFHHSPH